MYGYPWVNTIIHTIYTKTHDIGTKIHNKIQKHTIFQSIMSRQ